MKKWKYAAVVGGMAVAVAMTGCGGSQSAACVPVENGVGVCLEGATVQWPADMAKPPHMHENGGYYAPVYALESVLGVKAETSGNGGEVSVNGRKVEVTTRTDPKGIHDHDGQVYAPIQEFAEAAGFKVAVDPEKHTVSISK